MTRTEHDCRWRLLDAYSVWCAAHLPREAAAAVWAFYLALGLRAPLPWGPPPQEGTP
jgi:hypothetical protein